MRNGFTLVELSIVLVIIGLLIGGILVAQSLIDSAKINRFISQIQQFDAAVNSFVGRYKCLPGDDDKVNSVGNCDGFILSSSNDDRFNQEIADFWVDLALTGFNQGGLTGQLVSNEFEFGTSLPQAAIGNDCGVLAGMSGTGDGLTTSLGTNFYSIHGFDITNAGAGLFSNATCMYTETALAVDSKIDDGNAKSGNVFGGFANLADLSSFNTSTNNNCFSQANGSYTVGNGLENICGLHIRIDSH